MRKFFILHCPDNVLKFFCDCVFNVVKGKVKLDKKLQEKAVFLAREKVNLEKLCSKRRVALKRKRQVLGKERFAFVEIDFALGTNSFTKVMYKVTFRIISNLFVLQNFGICFRSFDRNVPSSLCHVSRSGHDGILDLRQYLATDGIINCPLNLNTNTVHHLVHLRRYPRI